MTDAYLEFVESKVKMANVTGFELADDDLHPILKPHQVDIVRWAVRGGNRAIFASFGLGKSVMQIEWARHISRIADGPILIVCPLGVRQELIRDGKMLDVDLQFIRSASEMTPGQRFYITNYESVRDGKLTPSLFAAASLDEASVLRSFGSKTYQEFLPLFEKVQYKLVNTATPSPNRFKELIHYAGFLGVMDTGQALTRFFQRNSEKAGDLTLYPHKEQEFWLWVSSWAVFVQKPSDLGHSDEGYELPPLDVRYHEISSDYSTAGADKFGQGLMFQDIALGLSAAASEKRNSLEDRVRKVVEIVRQKRIHAPVVPEKQRDGEGAEQGPLRGQQEAFQRAGIELVEEQSRARQGTSVAIPGKKPRGSKREKQSPLSEKQGGSQKTEAHQQDQAIWSDAGSIPHDAGITERMLCNLRSGSSIEQGERQLSDRPLSQDREGSRPSVHEVQLGVGNVQGLHGDSEQGGGLPDQVIIWCDLNDEQRALEKALHEDQISVASLYGSQSIEAREELFNSWIDGHKEAFVSKPVMYGAGVNLQQCHTMVFTGIGFKFADFIQAIHRIHRFGQKEQCEIHIIHSEAEREVLRTLQRKWDQHEEMVQNMTDIIKKYGLNTAAMSETLKRTIGIERIEVKSDMFTVANNDCVDEARRQPENNVDLIVTSIPFANHYEYTPSYNDFGHTENNDHFWKQMDFLTPEMLRILKPGRLYCCHTKDRIMFGNVTGAGVPTVSPFHCEAIMHGIKHGFDYMGMITVVTDVVRENNQTYRLGWSEQCKDGTKMGVGSPEYILLFRKPQSDRGRGYADFPVKKSKDVYTRARWQVDAHAFWRSSGNRQLTAEEMATYGPGKLAKLFTDYSLGGIYDYEFHVKIGEELDVMGALPATFMSLAPGSHHSDVWHDINRMLTLNGQQSNRNVEQHICPLQFDIVDRLIERYSNEGELVYDPFCGLGTVPYRAILKGRKGQGSELNTSYFFDSVQYLKAAEKEFTMPTLFDFEAMEEAA